MPKFFRSPSRSLHRLVLGTALPAAALLATSQAAPAQTPVQHAQATADTEAQVLNYWTPDRLRNAKPMLMHVDGTMRHGLAPHVSSSARKTVPGGLPTVDYDGSEAVQLFDPTAAQAKPGTKPFIVGTGGLPFTTNRLYPVGDKTLFKAYPYATFGQLFFSEPSGDYVCSASVIRANVIATAGHCVADGSGHYYSNWLFVPAENGAMAPYGKWTWAAADTTSSWFNGGGVVPNDQDDALIVLAEHKYQGAYRRIGDLVGYFGYEFNAALPTAVTQIGYPCNLDSCADPIAAYSQDNAGPNNNFQWGTASFGGASGGPEVQDFGQIPNGAPSEILGGNIVVSSTSYTYTAAGVDVDGGSIFYAPGQNGEYTFGDLINWACSFSDAC